MSTISEIRLKNFNMLIDEAGSVSELARLAGYAKPSYLYQVQKQYAIQNGKPKNIGDSMARKLEAAMQKETGWMDVEHAQPTKKPESNVGDVGTFLLWSSNTPLPEDEFVHVPFYKDIELSAGTGSFSDIDYNGFTLPFAKSTLRRYGIPYDAAACVSVKGKSMEPVLPDGSTVGVDTSKKNIIDGKMYAIRHYDMLRVKCLYRSPGGKVLIRSFNRDDDAFKDEIVLLEEIEIIGQVFTSSTMWV